LEVEMMSNLQCVSGAKPLTVLLSAPVRFVYATMIDPVRGRVRGRAGVRELARLDDHLLRDIGLTRAQVHAAAFGPIGRSRALLRIPHAHARHEEAPSCA
jgi:uncharacterized protein YjiS (DUF1127 family)